MDTRTLFDDFLMKEILAGRSVDFFWDDELSHDVSLRGPFREKNLSIPAAAGFFSLDASSGLLATRRRLGRRGDSSAMRSAFVARVVGYEEFKKKRKKKKG